ncbi:hypothetical protein K2F_25150 [Enterococcus thailandicus]|nr:hypothetical protein K2F_25150 [Enterococcus thailandicus]GMC02704.1 hypothetical protein K4E_02150 [Enterococcus thailandicus]
MAKVPSRIALCRSINIFLYNGCSIITPLNDISCINDSINKAKVNNKKYCESVDKKRTKKYNLLRYIK